MSIKYTTYLEIFQSFRDAIFDESDETHKIASEDKKLTFTLDDLDQYSYNKTKRNEWRAIDYLKVCTDDNNECKVQNYSDMMGSLWVPMHINSLWVKMFKVEYTEIKVECSETREIEGQLYKKVSVFDPFLPLIVMQHVLDVTIKMDQPCTFFVEAIFLDCSLRESMVRSGIKGIANFMLNPLPYNSPSVTLFRVNDMIWCVSHSKIFFVTEKHTD